MAGRRGAVAAGHPATAQAAADILQAGGNVFDAVLAGLCAACVCEPVLASFGGGGFLLARPLDGAARVYDFFAHTPKRKRPENDIEFVPVLADFGAATQEFHIGLGAAATPGTVAGLFEAAGDLGRLPMTEIVAPAIALAKAGYPATALQARLFDIVEPIYRYSDDSLALFGAPGAKTLAREGDVLRNPDFADVLESIAREGPDLFYKGEIGQLIARACAGGGGHLGMADLVAYHAPRHQPLETEYREVRMLTNPPPSTGGLLVAFALALLDGAPMAGERGAGAKILRLARVMAMTNRARIESGLTDGGAGDKLLDSAFLALYRDQIAGRPLAPRGTTHISVIDRDGNAAALTVSNGEGCGHLLPGCGFMLNNMLGEDDINPQGFHRWREDTRMVSMMTPSLILGRDGRAVALGSGGSNRIRTAILQVVLNMVDKGMPPADAVEQPRIHVEGGLLSIEPGLGEAALAALEDFDGERHIWPERNLFFGGVHAAGRDAKGELSGAGDSRRGGVAMVV